MCVFQKGRKQRQKIFAHFCSEEDGGRGLSAKTVKNVHGVLPCFKQGLDPIREKIRETASMQAGKNLRATKALRFKSVFY